MIRYSGSMGKMAINTTMLTVALTVAFSLVAFFSNSWFNRVTASATEFEQHKVWSTQLVSQLQGKDSLLEQRTGLIEKRLESIDAKLDRLLERR